MVAPDQPDPDQPDPEPPVPHDARTLAADTHPTAERIRFEIFRRMSASEKYRIVASLNETTRQLAEQRIRARHPEASDREIFLRLVSTWLGRDLMLRAYGVDPAEWDE